VNERYALTGNLNVGECREAMGDGEIPRDAVSELPDPSLVVGSA
jgi:hypothetical protein